MKPFKDQILRYDDGEYYIFQRHPVSYDALNFIANIEENRLCLYKLSKRINKEKAKEWAETMRVKAIEQAGEEEGMKRYLDILVKFDLIPVPKEGDETSYKLEEKENAHIINLD